MVGCYVHSFKCIYVLKFLLLSLDPELKEPLIEVIEKLLKDKTTVSLQHK